VILDPEGGRKSGLGRGLRRNKIDRDKKKSDYTGRWDDRGNACISGNRRWMWFGGAIRVGPIFLLALVPPLGREAKR